MAIGRGCSVSTPASIPSRCSSAAPIRAISRRRREIGEDFGYDEINLNVGCPSDRVKDGRFGACLMAEPALVADCVAAMKQAVGIPVTVKCRIGIDDQDPEIALDALARGVVAAGADALIVHARKAWLNGLSPKENRDIPPLDYRPGLSAEGRACRMCPSSSMAASPVSPRPKRISTMSTA